jgi:ATP/maltotriose-dependent transcriptional regulator MalT
MRTTVENPDTEGLVDQWCETFSTGNYPVCKSLALDLVQQTSLDRDPDQYFFAQKSMAQSLHFLGEHDAAWQIAHAVREFPIGEIATTTVHPRISMGVLLCRISALKGDLATSAAYLREITDYARSSNRIGLYQVLALAAIPIAFWQHDGQAAADGVDELRQLAEGSLHNYWMGWAANAAMAVSTVFGGPGAEEDQQICFDRLDPKQADHLATMDGRLISDLATARSQTGECGWTAIEIGRLRAASLSWFDPQGAARVMAEAKELARTSGVLIWNDRLRQTEAEIAARAASHCRKQRTPG